jgi:hypothetical protein
MSEQHERFDSDVGATFGQVAERYDRDAGSTFGQILARLDRLENGGGGGSGGPSMGVTDGSDAGPGEVGERITLDMSIGAGPGNNAWIRMGEFILPAGDWEFIFTLNLMGSGTPSGRLSIYDTTWVVLGEGIIHPGPGGVYCQGWGRGSVSQDTTVQVWGNVNAAFTLSTIQIGNTSARRVR